MIERQIKLIQLFINNAEQYLTSDDIATFLNVSNRTTRNDIKAVNTNFMKDLIVSVKSRGYQISTKQYTIKEVEKRLEEYTDKDHKILVTLGYQLLMNDTQLTLHQLEKTYHLTKKEILDYIGRIHAWCEKFDVAINVKPRKGIEVVGSQTNLNNATLHLNQLSTRNHRVESLILDELPRAHVDTITQIIKRNLNDFDIKTSDIQVEQLLIHLILIMKRSFTENINGGLNEEALLISNKIIEEINLKLGYTLNLQVTKLFSFFISYHFNKFDLGVQQLFIESYINRMIERMEERVGVHFTQDQVLKENLYSHFGRTYLRIMKEVYLNNPLTKEIKALYPFIFNVLYDIGQQMTEEAGVELTEDEIAFLTIHFQSSIDRNEQHHLNVVIACYYGIGISQLLATKVSKLSNHIKVKDTIRLEDIDHYDFTGIDMLITTHDIIIDQLTEDVELLQVSPLLSDDDKHQLETFMAKKLKPAMKSDEFSGVNFIVETESEKAFNTASIFEKAQDILSNNHAVLEGYIESALERERMSSTYIGNQVAIPHGNPEKVLKSHVIVFKSTKGFYWKEHQVKLAFFLATTKQDIQLTKRIIQTIAQLDEKAIDELIYLEAQSFKTKLMKMIKG
ncbi:BglG family transcription antiterminator [Staphylococcus simulans]|uniref:BglG family transcription antiterminator n=1 Tax=Staphylococcus simulans TaxID=1286 RepID=UPI000D045220|nr:BglG family transcription antiterminator [Staphylococcus simulans]MDQ7114161.1 BglG family transcription antiterminator [Staphylococcus simulans]MDQ7140173.1 BglG family transcription antiterminator [Staphylococcus simulans]PTJ16716.1 PRD domain-containing protein [Staphylococcus simulans]PTJ49010.1 PRD domain-containing protein [Staphylococcus simulans]PTJ87825.1 PRD domain-containing protein [Staphylococcus simulans]